MMGQQSPIVRLPTLDAMLTALPSLPRPVLSRLVAKMIDHMDALDDDPDSEDDDPDTSVEDGPEGFDPEEDYGAEELGEEAGGGEVCVDTRPIADPAAYREHRARFRRERCYPLRRVCIASYGYQARRLYLDPTTPTKRQLLRRKRGMPRRPRA